MGLADDDIILPKFLNDSQHIIQKHKNIGLIFSDMYSIDVNGCFDFHYKPNNLQEGYISPEDYMDKYILNNLFFHSLSGATIMKKNEIMNYKYDLSLNSFADTYNQWLIGLSRGAYYTNQIGFILRKNPTSYSQSENKNYEIRKKKLFTAIYQSFTNKKITKTNMGKLVNKFL